LISEGAIVLSDSYKDVTGMDVKLVYLWAQVSSIVWWIGG
jgi:hypothetical protein